MSQKCSVVIFLFINGKNCNKIIADFTDKGVINDIRKVYSGKIMKKNNLQKACMAFLLMTVGIGVRVHYLYAINYMSVTEPCNTSNVSHEKNQQEQSEQVLFFLFKSHVYKQVTIRRKKDIILLIKDDVFLAREERLELPTPGFGDRCSTN